MALLGGTQSAQTPPVKAPEATQRIEIELATALSGTTVRRVHVEKAGEFGKCGGG